MGKLGCVRLAPLGSFLVAVLLGCGGGGGNDPPPGNGTALAKTAGDAQVGTVGQALANQIQATVTEDGSPAAGVTVTWSTSSGTVNPASGPTDANGVAGTTWTLGTVAGAQTATGTVSGASGSPVTFTAVASAAAAVTLAKAGGDGQSAEAGAPLPLPVQAQVTDEHGNGVAGTSVGWAATGATVSSSAVPSDGSGVSQVTVTAGGTAGPITITATADGLDGSPLTFNGTATAVTPPPNAASVSVGNILFRSNRNTTTNPAVDTVAVNGTVTWSWVGTGSVTHSVLSQESPQFMSSGLLTGNGESHSFQFVAPGTYQYTCAAHPGQMTGRVVVR